MKLRPIVLLVFTTALLLISREAEAQTSLSVFAPKTGFAEGWKSGAWGGLATSEVERPDKNTTILEIAVKSDAQPFAGILLSATPDRSLDLTDELLQKGVVEILFQPGKTAEGETSAVPVPLQIALSFLNKNGETIHGKFNTQVQIAPDTQGTAASFDVATACEDLEDPKQLASISAVRIQYVGPPAAGFRVDHCIIKTK